MRRRANRKKGPSSTSPWLDKLRLEQEISESLENWCSDLKERAGLARLLEDRLGWRCAMDDETEGALESLLPVSWPVPHSIYLSTDTMHLRYSIGGLASTRIWKTAPRSSTTTSNSGKPRLSLQSERRKRG